MRIEDRWRLNLTFRLFSEFDRRQVSVSCDRLSLSVVLAGDMLRGIQQLNSKVIVLLEKDEALDFFFRKKSQTEHMSNVRAKNSETSSHMAGGGLVNSGNLLFAYLCLLACLFVRQAARLSECKEDKRRGKNKRTLPDCGSQPKKRRTNGQSLKADKCRDSRIKEGSMTKCDKEVVRMGCLYNVTRAIHNYLLLLSSRLCTHLLQRKMKQKQLVICRECR